MKSDIYALLYKKGTEEGKTYTEAAEKKRKALKKIGLLIGLPLLALVAYQYVPPHLSREITAEDMANAQTDAAGKKLEALYSNFRAYGESKSLAPLEAAFIARPGETGAAGAGQLAALADGGADVLAYHSVGRVLDGKVKSYTRRNFKPYSPALGAATRDPAAFSADLKRSMKKGKGTIVALIGSGREHYNILQDGSIDPDCSVGLLKRFIKDRPEYAGRLKVIFFHPYSPDTLFGQPEYEAEKFARIAEMGWTNAFLGIDLGKDDLAKPLVTEEGWQGKKFWPEGPGVTNFQGSHVALDKALTASRLKRLTNGGGMENYFWLPWAAAPKDGGAARELARSYSLLFVGYSGEKPGEKAPGIIPAMAMGSK